MIVVMAAFALLCLYQIKFSQFHADYMEPGQTGAIKGIFAVIVLFSHARTYFEATSLGDRLYCFPLDALGQLMVVLFFFYSGYGILRAYRDKENYCRGFFRSRILKTLVHFDIAVFLYLILGLALGNYYYPKSYVFCWVGWFTIGNSNWFVCEMLLLYLAALAAMLLANRLNRSGVAVCVTVTALSVLIGLALRWYWGYLYGGPMWFNVIISFPCGMWFALGKERVDGLIRRHRVLFWLVFALLFALFVPVYLRRANVLWHNVCAGLFCLIVVLFTAKVKLDNPVLRWLGKHSFAIYILQRIPMILFDRFGWDANHLVFLVISIAATLILSVVYDKLMDRLDARLFRPTANHRTLP